MSTTFSSTPLNWESQIWTGSKFCSRMKRYSTSNKPTLIKTTGAGAPRLPACQLYHQAPKKSKSVKVWARICATDKIQLVFVDESVKSNQNVYRRYIVDAVVVPWASRHFGRHKWTLQQDSTPATERNRRRSGARPIFQSSSHLRNGSPTRRISTQWITAVGKFWSPGAVLIPTKLWRLGSSHCSGDGTDYRQKSCGHDFEFLEAFYTVYCIKHEWVVAPIRTPVTDSWILHHQQLAEQEVWEPTPS